MKRSMLFALAAAAALSVNAQYVAKDGDKIAFMGDSTTVHGNQPDGYIGLFMYALERLGVKDLTKVPAGVSGNTSSHMKGRFKAWVVDNHPTIAVINCGVNDVWSRTGVPNVSLEAFRSNVVSMVDQSVSAGITPVLMTPTPVYEDLGNVFNKNLAGYVKCMHEIAAERKIAIGDANAAFQEDLLKAREAVKDDPKMRGANLLTADGVHMKYGGNKAMAWGLLKGFGVKDSQREQVEQFWREMPMLEVKVLVTRDEYAKLKEDAAAQNASAGVVLRERMVKAKVLGQ